MQIYLHSRMLSGKWTRTEWFMFLEEYSKPMDKNYVISGRVRTNNKKLAYTFMGCVCSLFERFIDRHTPFGEKEY